MMVHKMRTTTDDKVFISCATAIMNRAWGTPKATPDEDPRLKNSDMLGVLAAISIDMSKHPVLLSTQRPSPVAEALALDADVLEHSDE